MSRGNRTKHQSTIEKISALLSSFFNDNSLINTSYPQIKINQQLLSDVIKGSCKTATRAFKKQKCQELLNDLKKAIYVKDTSEQDQLDKVMDIVKTFSAIDDPNLKANNGWFSWLTKQASTTLRYLGHQSIEQSHINTNGTSPSPSQSLEPPKWYNHLFDCGKLPTSQPRCDSFLACDSKNIQPVSTCSKKDSDGGTTLYDCCRGFAKGPNYFSTGGTNYIADDSTNATHHKLYEAFEADKCSHYPWNAASAQFHAKMGFSYDGVDQKYGCCLWNTKQDVWRHGLGNPHDQDTRTPCIATSAGIGVGVAGLLSVVGLFVAHKLNQKRRCRQDSGESFNTGYGSLTNS